MSISTMDDMACQSPASIEARDQQLGDGERQGRQWEYPVLLFDLSCPIPSFGNLISPDEDNSKQLCTLQIQAIFDA